MQTILVELVNENALRILKDLEVAKIINLVPDNKNAGKLDLASRLRGTISKERAMELKVELEKMREEWNERGF
jgi:hypothetical protein